MRLFTRQANRRRSGFTLIEVTLGVFLITLIIGGIYAVARGALTVSSRVSEVQQREILLHSFLQLIRRNFENFPGNAGITMEVRESSGTGYYSDLIFYDAPLAFSWAGIPAGADRVAFITEKDPRGGMQARLVYLDEEAPEDFRGNMDDYTSLMLIDGLSNFEWRFYSVTDDEWLVEWEDFTQRPTLVELNMQFFGENEPIRSVFWVPAVPNPETVIGRRANQANPSQEGNPAQGQGPNSNNPGAGANPGGAQNPSVNPVTPGRGAIR